MRNEEGATDAGERGAKEKTRQTIVQETSRQPNPLPIDPKVKTFRLRDGLRCASNFFEQSLSQEMIISTYYVHKSLF